MGGSTRPITGSSSNCWLPAQGGTGGAAAGAARVGCHARTFLAAHHASDNCFHWTSTLAHHGRGRAKLGLALLRAAACRLPLPCPLPSRGLTLLKVEDGAQRRQPAALAHHADRAKARRHQRRAARAHLGRRAGSHRLGIHRLPPPILAVCAGAGTGGEHPGAGDGPSKSGRHAGMRAGRRQASQAHVLGWPCCVDAGPARRARSRLPAAAPRGTHPRARRRPRSAGAVCGARHRSSPAPCPPPRSAPGAACPGSAPTCLRQATASSVSSATAHTCQGLG